MLISGYIRHLMIMVLMATTFFIGACQTSGNGSETERKDASPYSTACAVSYETYAQGVESGFLIDQYALDEPTLFVIRTQEELERFWSKHAAIFFPQPAMPDIDFTQDMLIAVVDTVEPSGGYKLSIEALESSEGTVSVEVRKISPEKDVIVTDDLTVPYHIITLAQSDMEFVLHIAQ